MAKNTIDRWGPHLQRRERAREPSNMNRAFSRLALLDLRSFLNRFSHAVLAVCGISHLTYKMGKIMVTAAPNTHESVGQPEIITSCRFRTQGAKSRRISAFRMPLLQNPF